VTLAKQVPLIWTSHKVEQLCPISISQDFFSGSSKIKGQLFMKYNRKTENRNDPDLVQAFLKKWWVESDFKVPNLPLSLRLKVSGCHYNSIYNNT
jgi:hypothetical protein